MDFIQCWKTRQQQMEMAHYSLRLSVGSATQATRWFGDTSVHTRSSCCVYPLLYINNCCSILHALWERPDNIDVYIKVGIIMLLLHKCDFIYTTLDGF